MQLQVPTDEGRLLTDEGRLLTDEDRLLTDSTSYARSLVPQPLLQARAVNNTDKQQQFG